jgi:signal transduction histidine kinase
MKPDPTESKAKLPPHHLFTSLRVELLLSLALLAATALLIGIANFVVFENYVGHPYGGVLLGGLVVADVMIFILLGDYKIRELVIYPLDSVVTTTEAVSAGDLSRRVPPGRTSEFARLSHSINSMTSKLLEEQAVLARLEKVASVGRLAAGVAHEIGNPLGAISGYVHLLRKHGGASPEAQEAIAGLEREAGRIDRIMRGMLDYARPRRRTAEPFDVNGVVHRSLELLRDQGALRGVDIHLNLANRLPALVGDQHEMQQVLVNLLLNSVDAMNGDGDVTIFSAVVPFSTIAESESRRVDDPTSLNNQRPPNARLRAWLSTVGEPAQVIKMIVADSGPGVPWNDMERIFEPFFTTKEPGKGTGLGLAIVTRIVESLGGAIWVRASREGGAAFELLFPVPVDGPVLKTEVERPHAVSVAA